MSACISAAKTVMSAIEADASNWKMCIGSYADVFRATLLRENRMCLGGILAAERPALAPEVRAEVERFTELLVGWLTEVLLIGNPGMEQKAVRRGAFSIFAAIEGAQLVARGCGDVAVFDDTLLGYRSAGLLP
jgi:TetR/AcrR family transcriptional repressor of nem operon